MKRIVADPQRCLACRTCEFACALAHTACEDWAQAVIEEGARPSIYIEAAGPLAVPLQCRHCEDAPCIGVCPTAALARTSPDAPVLVDQDQCIGCEFCVQVCPFGVIRLAADRKVIVKCDLCTARVAQGWEPACVTACPVAALAFQEVDHGAVRKRRQTALQLATGESE